MVNPHTMHMDDGEWRVTDLLDEEQPLVTDAKLARQIVDLMANLENTNLDVRIPKAAIEFAEHTLSEWFETISEIEMKRGNIPYLINRSLYTQGSEGAPEWNQGLKLEDWKDWLSDDSFMETFNQNFYLTQMYDKIGENGPLSGYYNRIFPVKFVLRILAALSLLNTHEFADSSDDWSGDFEPISLDELRKISLEHAIYARTFLTMIDEESNKLKNTGSEISVGFPEDTEKARERFVAQFVGSMRKKQLSGALIEMGFANLPKFGPFSMDEIHFTKAGWKFMMLPNPLIDNGVQGWIDFAKTGKRFSEQEIIFLLEHFKEKLPNEWEHLRNISIEISKGNCRPKILDKELMRIYHWELTAASQIRNGAIGRMEELTLLTREKDGREVTYKLTDLARTLFEIKH